MTSRSALYFAILLNDICYLMIFAQLCEMKDCVWDSAEKERKKDENGA